MDKATSKKFELLLYYMQKQVCNNDGGWNRLLEMCEVSEQEWHEIKLHLEATYGVKTYV